MKKYQIPLAPLLAVLGVCSSERERPQLAGVAILRAKNNSGFYAIGTDGHCALMHKLLDVDNDLDGLVIKADALRLFVKFKVKDERITFCYNRDKPSQSSLTAGNISIKDCLVVHAFPDFFSVIPEFNDSFGKQRITKICTPFFDYRVLEKIAKAAPTADCEEVPMSFVFGSDVCQPFFVFWEKLPDITGIIMPMVGDKKGSHYLEIAEQLGNLGKADEVAK